MPMPGLEALRMALMKGSAEAGTMIRDLGERYYNLAKTHPGFMKYDKPALGSKGIYDQYGVKVSSKPRSIFDPSEGLYLEYGDDGMHPFTLNFKKGADLLPENVKFSPPLAAVTDPRKEYGVVNSIMGAPGSGMGTKMYPAAFDIMNELGLKNMSDSTVTNVNAWRKPFANTVPSMVRTDSNLVIPHPKSLYYTKNTPAQYLDFDLPSQIGTNLSNGALGALDALDQTLFHYRRMEGPYLASRGMNMEDVQAGNKFSPSYGELGGLDIQNSSFDDYANAADLLHRATGSSSSLGSSSLRRLGIIDSLLQGEKIQNPDLSVLQGVDHYKGGSVRRF